MSNYEQKPNSWVLFKNEKKTAENQPDYRGTLVLEDGTEKSISAWVRKSKGGKTYMSGAISEPYKADNAPKQTQPVQSPELNNDLPF